MAESGGLENRCAGNPGTEGSNPSPLRSQATWISSAAAATPATVRTWLPAVPAHDGQRAGLALPGSSAASSSRDVVGHRHGDLADG